jgi:bifunctional non-homologous end joining protein LigD
VHGGFTPATRAALFKQFAGVEYETVPVQESARSASRPVGGLTTAEMEKCHWLKPQLVATIDYLEWTVANHLRHPVFVRLAANHYEAVI